nr:MAG TPA: Protein of unknown function (DUF2852) [Caudoviricetes sp.]
MVLSPRSWRAHREKTMLRTNAAGCHAGKSLAAHLLSMVFGFGVCWLLGV